MTNPFLIHITMQNSKY